MDRIVIEVDNTSAKKWRFASPQKREKITKTIEQIINQSFLQSDEEYWQFLDRIGQEAAANGLTEEKLKKILSDK